MCGRDEAGAAADPRERVLSRSVLKRVAIQRGREMPMTDEEFAEMTADLVQEAEGDL